MLMSYLTTIMRLMPYVWPAPPFYDHLQFEPESIKEEVKGATAPMPSQQVPRTNTDKVFGEIKRAFNPKTDIIVMSPDDYVEALTHLDWEWLNGLKERVIKIEDLAHPSIVRAGGGLNFSGGFFKQ